MPSTLPSRFNGYAVALKQPLTREFFRAFLSDIHERLSGLELTEADYEAAIDAITTQALAIVSATISTEIASQRAVLAEVQGAVDELLAEYDAVEQNGISSTLVRMGTIAGFPTTTLQKAIEDLVAGKADEADFASLAGTLTGQVSAAIASIDTRELLLAQALALTGTR